VRTINAPPRTEQGNGHGPAFQAFCRGAGLDPGALSIEQATAALSLAGQLVRELALGLITAQQNRVESTGRFPLEDTAARRAEQNPFKLGASVDEVLARLFGPRSTRFLPPLDAVRSSFTELRRHEQASQLAMQTALAEFLRRLEPAHLEPRFVEALKRSGPLPAQPGQKYWDMYGEIYRVLAQISPNGLPHAFAEEYARAYEKTLAELSDGDRRPGASVGDSRRAP
jgi:type VI secretion system FHA domain protein